MNKIRELRKEKGLTLKELSDDLRKKGILDIAADTLGKYERGEREPKLKTWLLLAKYFDVYLYYLQGFSDTRKWTPGKGEELLKQSQIKKFNQKYKDDKKILNSLTDEQKNTLNSFDDDISLLKAILLNSHNKNDSVISFNTNLMFFISVLIEKITQNLASSYYPSKDGKPSEINNEKMFLLSAGYFQILNDTIDKIDSYNSKSEKEKVEEIANLLDIDGLTDERIKDEH